ncbi:MAG: YncE family protein [Thaumarchaeota archaeon]|nr:YncE family protein [Nitrososphaerota archaeon]MDE1826962.1 YncE family protein [Nitrososphaerota archaeon]
MNKKFLVGIGAAIALVIALAYLMTSMEKNENEESNNQNLTNLSPMPLGLIQTISLPNVSGRIDHMDVDINGQRLFVAELGNNSLDVLDLKAGKRISSISGLDEPQGVVFVPEAKKIFVANGGDGTVQVFDSDSYTLVKTITLSSDADNVRYDPVQKLVYVGYGNGGLAIIDPVKDELVDTIKLDGHPESFQISDELQPEIFVNVPESDSIELIDAQKRTVVTKWPNNGSSGNYPMALDEGSHRLFVVYRQPSELYVFDTDSGKIITKLAVGGDPDDIFQDGTNKQIYISGGQGFIDVISEQGDNYHELAKIPTDNGARTSLFVPQLNRLYVAIPDYSGEGAKIQVFETHKIQ